MQYRELHIYRGLFIIIYMPLRSTIAPFEYYHLFNRAVRKEDIFLSHDDYARMMFLILHLQSPVFFRNVSRHITLFSRKKKQFFVPPEIVEEIIKTKEIDLYAFAIMPNHFHLFASETKEGGIPLYLQRIQIAYAKYFNLKYKKSGYVFQGRFKAVHVTNNDQGLYLSAYIHRNPRGLPNWKNKEDAYPWSSYQDFVKENRWDQLLSRELILGQFNNGREYRDFVETSGAKDLLKEDLQID